MAKWKKLSDEVIRFTKPNGETVEDRWVSEDYQLARKIGRTRLGILGVYYNAGFKKMFIPLETIDWAYRRVEPVSAKLCCGRGDFDVQYIVLNHEGAELAVLEFENERQSNAMLDALQAKLPDLKVGYFEDSAN